MESYCLHNYAFEEWFYIFFICFKSYFKKKLIKIWILSNLFHKIQIATIEIKEATIMIVAKATNTAHGSLLFDNLPSKLEKISK